MSLPRIERERLAVSGSLVADYLDGLPPAVSLFPAGPALDATTLGSRIRSLSRRPARLPAAAFRTTTSAAAMRLSRILAGEGVFVSTGQQPLLFLGPLFTLYKACAAIRLAASVEQATGLPALALFWIASDDHDWREVAATSLVDREGELHRYALEAPAESAYRSVGPTPLPDSVDEVRRAFVRDMGTSDFSAPFVEALSDSYVPGMPFAKAFWKAFQQVIGGHDLAFLDSSTDGVKEAAAAFMVRTLESHAEVERALQAGASAVEEAGYKPSLSYLPGATPVFYDAVSGRRRLYLEEGKVRAGRDGPTRSLADVSEECRAEPRAFGPNAALRPVLESWLLPVAVSVLGPGEIHYWAQLSPLFSVLDVPMPHVAPRDSWRIVERSVLRALERADSCPEDLVGGGAQVIARIVREGRPGDLDAELRSLGRTLDEAFARLDDRVVADLPGVRSALGKAQAAVRSAIEELQKRVDARVREAEEVALGGIRRAAGALYPGGQPQERVASPYPFLVRYGPELVKALVAADRLSGSVRPPGVPHRGVAGVSDGT